MSVVLPVLVVMTLFLVGLRPTLRCGVVDGAICSLLLYLLPWWVGCGAFCLFMANPQTFLFPFALLSMPARATLTIPSHKCMSAKQIPCQVGQAKQAITWINIAVPYASYGACQGPFQGMPNKHQPSLFPLQNIVIILVSNFHIPINLLSKQVNEQLVWEEVSMCVLRSFWSVNFFPSANHTTYMQQLSSSRQKDLRW